MVKGVSLYHLAEGVTAFHLTNSAYPQVFGVDQDYFNMFPIRITEGKALTDKELGSKHQVVMINEDARDELFPDGDAINKKVEINGMPFRVAAIFTEKSRTKACITGSTEIRFLSP